LRGEASPHAYGSSLAAVVDRGHEVSKADCHYAENHGAGGQRRPRQSSHRL